MPKTSLSTPWVEYARKLYILFGQDPDINVIYNDTDREVKLYVVNLTKADAMAKELPEIKTFGNVELKITIVPANTEDTPIDTFRKIFTGNPILKDIIVDDDRWSLGISHIVFENKVVQYFNDCLSDPSGLDSTLYEDIAREVFDKPEGVFFNTEASDDVQIWP